MAREKMSRNKSISKDTRTLFEFDLFSYIVYYYYPQNNVIKKISRKKVMCWKMSSK